VQADIVLLVLGAKEVAVLFAELVAIETAPAGLFGRQLLEANNSRGVAAALGMGLARAVTSFASFSIPARAICRGRSSSAHLRNPGRVHGLAR
jgi:hypothetical protein